MYIPNGPLRRASETMGELFTSLLGISNSFSANPAVKHGFLNIYTNCFCAWS
jgi:hypothetical protein